MNTISVKRLAPNATLPTRAHPEDAGMDLYSVEETVVGPGHSALVKTGVAMAIPEGFVGMVADRSSLAKKGLKVAGGIIDAGYRGEIMVVLWNLSKEEIHLKAADRIAQLLLIPVATPAVAEVSDLGDTKRGAGGFGSSGR